MSDTGDVRVLKPGSAEAPAPADREAWIAAGASHVRGRSQSSWDFADWLAEGVAAWGREATADAAKITGASPGKIYDYLKVATTYPDSKRLNTLGFSHHLAVMRLPEAEADELLGRAAEEGWSVAALREVVRESRESRIDRLQAENARLRARLAALKRGPKDARQRASRAAQQLREDLRGDLRAYELAARRIAERLEAAAESATLADLHGNARRSLEEWMRKALDDAGRATSATAKERSLPAVDRLARGAGA